MSELAKIFKCEFNDKGNIVNWLPVNLIDLKKGDFFTTSNNNRIYIAEENAVAGNVLELAVVKCNEIASLNPNPEPIRIHQPLEDKNCE